MVIISGKDISKSYGTDIIFEDVCFGVDEGDRIGVVGANGTGKSTLLGIIAGDIERSSGELYIRSEQKIGYLRQQHHFEGTGTVIEEARALMPDLMIVDSVQTMYTDTVESAPGSVSQIKEVAAALLRFAKESGVPVILIGHITKDGFIAGPKILEHIVDVVLQFEGENRGSYRILRSIKNRILRKC